MLFRMESSKCLKCFPSALCCRKTGNPSNPLTFGISKLVLGGSEIILKLLRIAYLGCKSFAGRLPQPTLFLPHHPQLPTRQLHWGPRAPLLFQTEPIAGLLSKNKDASAKFSFVYFRYSWTRLKGPVAGETGSRLPISPFFVLAQPQVRDLPSHISLSPPTAFEISPRTASHPRKCDNCVCSKVFLHRQLSRFLEQPPRHVTDHLPQSKSLPQNGPSRHTEPFLALCW